MEISIHTPEIRLDAALKLAGLCSTGGEAKLRIQSGEVTVQGEVCTARGKKLFPGMIFSLDGTQVVVRAWS